MRKRSIAFDVLVASLALAAGQFEVWGSGTALATHRQGPHWAQALCYGIPAVLLAFRRIRPLAVLYAMVAVMAAEFAVFGSPEGFGVAVPPVIAVYTVANLEERGRALWGLAGVLVMGAAWIGFDPVDTTWRRGARGCSGSRRGSSPG